MSFKVIKEEEQVQEEKLEDILRSIRGMIDNHNPSAEKQDNEKFYKAPSVVDFPERLKEQIREKESQHHSRSNSSQNGSKKEKNVASEQKSKDSILELTDEFIQEKNTDKSSVGLTSNEIINKSADLIKQFTKELANNNYKQEDKIESMVIDLLRPLLKDWLDHNLPKLVEKMIAEELKRLIPKSNC